MQNNTTGSVYLLSVVCAIDVVETSCVCVALRTQFPCEIAMLLDRLVTWEGCQFVVGQSAKQKVVLTMTLHVFMCEGGQLRVVMHTKLQEYRSKIYIYCVIVKEYVSQEGHIAKVLECLGDYVMVEYV